MKATVTRRGSREAENDAAKGRVLHLLRQSVALFEPLRPAGEQEQPLITILHKSDTPDDSKNAASKQGKKLGRVPHPFNYRLVKKLKDANCHHSACIDAKVAATVGMGFKKPSTKKKLDTLVPGVGFKAVLEPAVEDFYTVGGGAIEIRRDDKETMIAAHFLPMEDVHRFVEPKSQEFGYSETHWEYNGSGDYTSTAAFANFGDRVGFMERGTKGGQYGIGADDIKNPSEVVYIPKLSAKSRWYGYPEWLAASASIELSQAIRQQQFDFFVNRGVPEFLLFILGGTVGPKDWTKIERTMQSTIGPGNQGKSLALNLPGENLKVELHKLGLEGKTDGGAFSDQSTTLALDITSAHRTPAIIAGIQVPGKMGASNEAMNAIWSFQLLSIGPAQETIKDVLKNTFGKPESEGGLGLTADDDFDFVTLTDTMGLGAMAAGGAAPGQDGVGNPADTMARMRTPLPVAQAQGRDLNAGLKKMFDKMDEEKMGQLIAGVILELSKQAA